MFILETLTNYSLSTRSLPHSLHLTGKFVFIFLLLFNLYCFVKKRESVHACKVWSLWPPQEITFFLSSIELWRLLLRLPRVTRDWLENILLFLKQLWHLQYVHFRSFFIAKGHTHKICLALTSTQLKFPSLTVFFHAALNLMFILIIYLRQIPFSNIPFF